MELDSVFYNSLYGKRILKRADICITFTAVTAEIYATLPANYTTIKKKPVFGVCI